MGHHQTATSSRLENLRNTGGGEIVKVHGGHIIRSTGRKDRHSKVCTAKGPRDRRVRLSAQTAIQFYDVQDRLGYDRPSKAVDWLINKAKAAIDELEKLPAWKPTTNLLSINTTNIQKDESLNQQQQQLHSNGQQQQSNENNNSNFPIGASIGLNSPSSSAAAETTIQFHQNFPPPDLLSRTSSQNQDLRLSLQSFQDPMLLHHHNHQNEQAAGLFSVIPQMGFDLSGWSESSPGELGRFQRMVSWNSGGDTGGGGAFVFNSPPQQAQPLFGQTHQLLFSQREPLQSSNTPSVRAWIDPSAFSSADDRQAPLAFHSSSLSGIGFASGGGFSGFRIPARIQGEEEERDGTSDKPSSASSDSRY